MFMGPLAFYNLLSEVVDEVNTELGTTAAGSPDRVCVVPGQIAWDDCECGQLAGTINQWFFSNDFPASSSPGVLTVSACQAAWVVADMGISILRCAPGPIGDDLAPTCERLDEAAQTHIIDAHTVRNTVACLLQDMKNDDRIVDYGISGQVATGPAGMCVGSELTFLVSLDRTV